MRTHRFFIGGGMGLGKKVEISEVGLLRQWGKVLRFAPGQELILFDGRGNEAVYVLEEAGKQRAELSLSRELKPVIPKKDICLLWSLLKKDKNDWVLQKCTELGVTRFIPLLAGRTEKTGFNSERAKKIIIEAAEQCGRGDIPEVLEPLSVTAALSEFTQKADMFIAEKDGDINNENELNVNETRSSKPITQGSNPVAIMVGPEGGWTDQEKRLFKEKRLKTINLSDFTLRAETACVVSAVLLLQ